MISLTFNSSSIFNLQHYLNSTNHLNACIQLSKPLYELLPHVKCLHSMKIKYSDSSIIILLARSSILIGQNSYPPALRYLSGTCPVLDGNLSGTYVQYVYVLRIRIVRNAVSNFRKGATKKPDLFPPLSSLFLRYAALNAPCPV